ncbi:MAG: ATP-binding cassette domain-containing protein [Porticoccaceae bacterium]
MIFQSRPIFPLFDLTHVSTRGIVRQRVEQNRAEELGKLLSLRCAHVSQPVSALSGGNQQKVAIAKMLSVQPDIIIFDEPTRGVDVGAKSEIYSILRNLAAEGVGVLVISSEMPELIGLCDRILVLHEGSIAGEVEGETMTEEEIMKLGFGVGVPRNTPGKEGDGVMTVVKAFKSEDQIKN